MKAGWGKMLTEADSLALLARILGVIGGAILTIAAFVSFKVEIDRIRAGTF